MNASDRLREGEIGIFVPRPGTIMATHLKPGSAVVGVDIGPIPDSTIVYYEGNLYGAANLHSYAAKLKHALGRMRAGYPTTAKALVGREDLVRVGRVIEDQPNDDPLPFEKSLGPAHTSECGMLIEDREAASALREWAGEEALSGASMELREKPPGK